MRCGLILKKMGMTRVFEDNGNSLPVTILKLENTQVVKVLDIDKNGYTAIQVGSGEVKTKKVNKATRGHFAKSKVEPKRLLKEFKVSEDMLVDVGKHFSVSHFTVGQKVDVSGISIGKGFSGGMKRHNFSGLEATHGVSISHRSHGSTGNSQDPGRVWKGKKMAGQYGNVKKTVQNLTVLQINNEEDLIYVKGSVPGPKNGYLTVKDAVKSKLPENVLKPAGYKELNDKNEKEDQLSSDKLDNVDISDNKEAVTSPKNDANVDKSVNPDVSDQDNLISEDNTKKED